MQRTSIASTACHWLSRRAGTVAADIQRPRWIHQLCKTTNVRRVPPLEALRGRAFYSTSDANAVPSRPLTDRNDNDDVDAAKRKADVEAYRAEQPSYQLTFTCAKCMERSSHRISKQGYHKGTVLVNCPGCKNKHLISDHLRIFSDRGITLEDIMKEKGELLKKGILGSDGDVEFYEEPDVKKLDLKELDVKQLPG